MSKQFRKLAKEAGWPDSRILALEIVDKLIQFSKFVREDEREACAKIVEADAKAHGKKGGGLVLLKVAERIRARDRT
jgi:hypothetical protein